MRLVLALAALVVVVTACGGGSGKQSASDFAVQELNQAAKGQNGKRWDDLHPALQQVISKDKFIECNQSVSFPASNIKATDEYDEPTNAPGVGQVDSKAVTVSYKLGETTDSITIHVAQVDGAWKWFVTQDSFDAYSKGECP